MRPFLCAVALCVFASPSFAATDWGKLESTATGLRDQALHGSEAYPLLESLTTEVGQRLAATEAEHRAALWAVAKMKALGFQNVHIEPFSMPQWTRGEERAEATAPFTQKLAVTALGRSVATPPEGVEAEIALFKTYEDLLAQPEGALKGKIAVVTQPMVKAQDGEGYGALVRMRTAGPSEAAKRSAVAYLIRSLATDDRRAPHTGVTDYAPGVAKIPAGALAVPDSEWLDRITARGQAVRLKLVLTPKMVPGGQSETVVGEIVGRERPDEIVLIGGHLDSWDLGQGAIDDGAGVAVTMAAAKLIADLPQHPRRTLRVALFGAEEVGETHAPFAKAHAAELDKHVIASECDFGATHVYRIDLPAGAAGSPYGKALANVVARLPASVGRGPAQDGGADVEDLTGVPLAELAQDGTHYFDLHHTADDTLDKVDAKEMDRLTAAWVAFAYLAADSDVDFRAIAKEAAETPKRRR
jgi:hypothetical protein